MGRIRQLDEQTTNLIAAGEVVERPMGVVKELVDNAIDAGSTRITVTIEEGGIQKITVQDNGCGMDAEDAEMAFHRHATSKIRSEKDLWTIHTLGFRGEAMPSIAAVSKMTMCTSDGNESTRMVLEYGKVVEAGPYPCNQGTEITVEGLFYHTPARLKHMRSGSYEASLIQDVINRFALSHPEIAFRLVSEGREVFRTSGQNNLFEVMYGVYGRGAAEQALEVNFSDFDYEVTGYIVKPEITRASRNQMYIFLNGRMVHTYRLYRAVCDGYEDFIVKGRFPMVILNIKMDPHLLDVNVHPSKWEVRISKEKQLERLLQEEVHNILAGENLAVNVEPSKAKVDYYAPMSMDLDSKVEEPVLTEYQKEVLADQELMRQITGEGRKEESYKEEKTAEEITETQETVEIKQEEEKEVKKEEKREERKRNLPEMRVIGQLHSSYILAEVDEGLAVVDPLAAMERISFEELSEELNRNPVMVDLLVPCVIQAGSDMVLRCDELNEAVSELHVEYEAFGSDTLTVRRIPSWMRDLDYEMFLTDLLDHFKEDRDMHFKSLQKSEMAKMAVKRSRNLRRSLTSEEMKRLLEKLAYCENPYHSPAGKSTFVVLEEKEIAKEFLK